MKKIMLFDTSLGTRNQGDYVIRDAIDREMSFLFDWNVIYRLPTHTPIARGYQALFGDVKRMMSTSDYKFLCGTNLLKYTLLRPNRDWNIGVLDSSLYRNSIALGCGVEVNSNKPRRHASILYKHILSKEYKHSVRDERTRQFIKNLGFEAINTGCPTTWGLRQESVEKAFESRADDVVFTLTDYSKNPSKDIEIVRLLKRFYRKIWFWPQGSEDYEYAEKLGILQDVELIPPGFSAFQNFQDMKYEYVGTRLHGGIYALSSGHRAIVIAVDHRAIDVGHTTGLYVVPRDRINDVERLIKITSAPVVNVPHNKIQAWKEQFK